MILTQVACSVNYFSNKIQNEAIGLIDNTKFKLKMKYHYSLFDDTTNVAHHKHISQVIQYIYTS
jgi:hypothetical protein